MYSKDERLRLMDEANPECQDCRGLGLKHWPNTAIGHGGIAGQSFTEGPCDCTWTFEAEERRIVWARQWRDVTAPSMPMNWVLLRYNRRVTGVFLERSRHTNPPTWSPSRPRVWAQEAV